MKLLVGAGGTGGHLYPAIAVVEEIKSRFPEAEIIFAGRDDKIEGRVIPQLGYEFIPLPISASRSITGLINIFLAAIKLKKLIKKRNIDAVICTGCYISIPPGMAAMKAKVPLFLLESNVNPGKAIKMLSSKANTIFTTFPDTKDYFSSAIAANISLEGNPIRKEIINLPEKENSLKIYDIEDDKPILLVFGGSLGAKSINETMENNIEQLSKKANVIWQTGNNYEVLKNMPENVKVLKYIDDMASAYAVADLVVSRSGATTVTELTTTGKPAILIPYKHSANNEQLNNANFLEKNAGAVIIDNDDVKNELIGSIIDLINDKKRLNDIAIKTKELAKPEATKKIANKIIEKINGK